MKGNLRTHAGLFLVGLGIVYLIWFAPVLPAWGWALIGSALFFALAGLRNTPAAAGYGAFFLGWTLGAVAADITGLQSLKLVGTGLGLVVWGRFENTAGVSWLGGALTLAGVLVFIWEASLGGWVALLLLASGLYLALREPPKRHPQPKASGERTAAIIRWRNEEARRRGVLNTEIISDEEMGCLAALPKNASLNEVANCLGGDEKKAQSLCGFLKE